MRAIGQNPQLLDANSSVSPRSLKQALKKQQVFLKRRIFGLQYLYSSDQLLSRTAFNLNGIFFSPRCRTQTKQFVIQFTNLPA